MRDDRLHPGRADGNTERALGMARTINLNMVQMLGAACLDCDDAEVVRRTLLWSVS